MTDAKQFSATLFLRHIVSRFSHLFSKSNCTLLLFVLRFEIRKKVIQIQVHFELNDQFKVHRGTVFENYRKSLILQWRAKRATFTFWVDKCQKWSILTSFFLTWSLLSKSVTRTKNHHKYNFFCLKIFVAGIYKLDLVFFKLWQFLGRRRRLQQDWEAGVQTLISWRRWDHLTISWVSYFVWSRCCWQLMGAHNAFGSKVMAIWRGCFMSVDPAL